MRVGVALAQYDVDFVHGHVDAAAAIDYALAAEEAGLDSVWLSDHAFAVATDGSVSGSLDAAPLAAAVAARTTRVEVGTLVLSCAIRSPEETAAIAAAIRSVAGPRATCGIGAGWNPVTHAALGIHLGDYTDRAGRLGTTAALVRGLEPRTRLLVGGWGEPVLAVAARLADTWNLAWDVPPEAFRAVSARLDAVCEASGRDPRDVRRSIGVTVLVGETRAACEASVTAVAGRAPFLSGLRLADVESRIVTGTPERCAEAIAAFGADEVVVTPFVRDDADLLAAISSDLAPLLR